MPDDHVQLEDIRVMRVRADMKGKGPPEAFELLESRLPTLKHRRFYGTFRFVPGGEEYYACVEVADADEPSRMQLETGVIPGGRYARRKVKGWEKVVREGRLPGLVVEFAEGKKVDPERPTIEYYRSREELHILLPVKDLT